MTEQRSTTKPTEAELLGALYRADEIIEWMMSYLGRMAPPENGIYHLNEHGLFMQRLKKRRPRGWRGPRGKDERPLDQKPER